MNCSYCGDSTNHNGNPCPKAWIDDIKILSFEIRGIDAPGRVYSHPAYNGTLQQIVSFNVPVKLDPKVPDTRWSGLPTMFLYVDTLEEAIELARAIGKAHKEGNVD
jgi:hypothetical protein